MKKFYVCTNLKINLGIKETLDYAGKLSSFVDRNLAESSNVEVFFFPDFLSLYPVSQLLKNSKLKFGSQNCYWEEKGPFTGETSVSTLKEIGCSYVMAGHPERLLYFSETYSMVNKKIKTILKNNLTPLVFVIEKEKGKSTKQVCSILKRQLTPLLSGIEPKDVNKIVLFYEPAWAIGTLSSAPIEHTSQVIRELRELLSDLYGKGVGENQIFMYGGGVTLESAKKIIQLDNINGFGMGKAALNLEFFTDAINVAIDLKRNA